MTLFQSVMRGTKVKLSALVLGPHLDRAQGSFLIQVTPGSTGTWNGHVSQTPSLPGVVCGFAVLKGTGVTPTQLQSQGAQEGEIDPT